MEDLQNISYTVVNMEKTAIILLFVGAILLAFQIAGNIGYISSIITLPLALPIKPLLNKSMQEQKGKRKFRDFASRTGYFILFIISALVFLVVGTVMLPVMIVYLFIGQPLLAINTILNVLYHKSLEPWRDEFFSQFHLTLAFRKIETKLTDEEIWKKTREKEIPFLALFGVVCLTVGFILQLVQ